MLLYLTSLAAQTLDKLTPYIPQYHPGLTVAFVPTAANVYEKAPWMDKDKEKLEEMGFHVIVVDIKGKTKDDLRIAFANVDILFVAGGNSFYLLEQAKKSGFDIIAKELIAKGIIYIGSSAGSVLVAPNIEPVQAFDDPVIAHLDSYEAMGVVPFLVLPHYTPEDSLYTKVMEEYKDKYQCIPLANNQAVLVTEEGYEIIQ